MTDNQRLKRIEKAQVRVLYTVPFFAAGVAKLPVEFDDDTPTASTNGIRVKFGRAFCDKLTDGQLVTVLCHEVAHCMLGHLWRAPFGAEWDTWNQATDHAINTMLNEFSNLTMEGGKYANPFPWPDWLDGKICADPQFTGMAEEVIYSRLASVKKPGDGRMNVPGGKKGTSQAQGTGPGGKNGDPTPGLGQIEKPGDADGAEPGGGGAGQPGQTSSKQLLNDWTATLLQAAKIAAGQGNLPGSMSKLVDAIVNPKLDWTEILRSWLREQCADDWNWLSPAMEFEGSGFILPSLKSERMGPVVFGSDWSGSTFGELVNKFHAEKQNCLDDMRPAKLVDIGFDTRVLWEKEYLPGEKIDSRIAGGGGTSFVDVLRRCEDLNPSPKAVVILTDLDGEFPTQAPSFPVIWVCYGSDSKKAPFGETIYAD